MTVGDGDGGQFEADRRAINITLNSLGTELTKARHISPLPNTRARPQWESG